MYSLARPANRPPWDDPCVNAAFLPPPSLHSYLLQQRPKILLAACIEAYERLVEYEEWQTGQKDRRDTHFSTAAQTEGARGGVGARLQAEDGNGLRNPDKRLCL